MKRLGVVTHGRSYDPIYYTWQSMVSRCTVKNSISYKNYGGRGVTVCKRWMKFENFLEDIGERPEGKSLDRIDNNKGYSKENCRWATAKEQARNKRNTNFFQYEGEFMSLPDIADIIGMKISTLRDRLIEKNMDIETATRKPLKRYLKR